MTADYWLLAAPLVGSSVNLIAQVTFARLLSGERLVLVVVAAFCTGLIATGVTIGCSFSLAELSTFDALGLAASVYFGASFVLFAIVNLGETSLRIRMMRMLLESPRGITRDELLAAYDDRALIAVRLQRLRDNRQARVVDDIYYSRPSFLFFAYSGIRLLQRIVYGKR
jgi:hypothetical protein